VDFNGIPGRHSLRYRETSAFFRRFHTTMPKQGLAYECCSQLSFENEREHGGIAKL